MDSYIGQLRAHFNGRGNRGPWNPRTKEGNPCISVQVGRYLKAIRLEQAEAHVTPKQATPMFSDRLRWLVAEIRGRIQELADRGEQNLIKPYLLHRDIAFFFCLWWSGDRAADLGRTKTCEVTRIADRDLLFNHTIGKTVREGDSSIIVIPKLDSEELDPVGAVDKMVDLAHSGGYDLTRGYLFRS